MELMLLVKVMNARRFIVALFMLLLPPLSQLGWRVMNFGLGIGWNKQFLFFVVVRSVM